jgi:hypothetical protein
MKCNAIWYKNKIKAKLKENKTRVQKQKFPSTKKGNTLQAPLASEQTGLGQGVW